MYSSPRMPSSHYRSFASNSENAYHAYQPPYPLTGLADGPSTRLPQYSQLTPYSHVDPTKIVFRRPGLEEENQNELKNQSPVRNKVGTVQKRTKIEEFPYSDATGPFYLYKFNRTSPPLAMPPADRIAESTRPSIPQTTDDERSAVQWEGRLGQSSQEVGRGLDSGKKWLGRFDSNRPDVLVTKCALSVDGKVKRLKKGNNYPPGNTVIPAGKSLQEICLQYPNHVWGKMLRIFCAEGWSAAEMYNTLPEVAQTPRQQDLDRNRPHNYLQQAIGRQIDDMLLEEGKHRKIRQQKNKSHKRKAPRADDEEFEDEDLGGDEDKVGVDLAKPLKFKRSMNTVNRPTKSSRKSKFASARNVLSVQQCRAVTNMIRQPNSSNPYPNSVEEMELQQKVDFYTQRSKLMLSDRCMNEHPELTQKGLAERLEFIEPEWRDEFNKHVKQQYLGHDPNSVWPPVLVASMSPLEIMMTVIEYQLTLNGDDKWSDDQIRQLAYKRLLAFLQGLNQSIQRYFHQQIDESTLKDGVHENMSSINPADGGLRSNIDYRAIIDETTVFRAPVEIPRATRIDTQPCHQLQMPALNQHFAMGTRRNGGRTSGAPNATSVAACTFPAAPFVPLTTQRFPSQARTSPWGHVQRDHPPDNSEHPSPHTTDPGRFHPPCVPPAQDVATRRPPDQLDMIDPKIIDPPKE